MARTKEINNATRRHIWFDDDDWQYIIENFQPRGIGPSYVIRQVMGAWVKSLKDKAEQSASPAKGNASVEEIISAINSEKPDAS